MNYLATTRQSVWLIVYFVAGFGVLINLLGEAYSKTLDLCEMYPQFSFQETLLEEITIHHTRLPLLRLHVPTLYLLGMYIVAYAMNHWGLVNRVDFLYGRWLYHQLFELFPTYLPFVSTEPDVPELLSEDEARDVDEKDGDFDDNPLLPMDDEACKKALAKLVQVKMQHANQTISRPDEWLVFDPVQEKLVLKKQTTCMGVVDHKILKKHNSGRKGDFWREQTRVGDSDHRSAEVATKIRKRS